MTDVPEWESDPENGGGADEPGDGGFAFESWLSEATSFRTSSDSAPGDTDDADGGEPSGARRASSDEGRESGGGFELSVGGFDFDAWLANTRREPEPSETAEEPPADADAAEAEGFDFAGWLGEAGAADAVAAVTGTAAGAGTGTGEVDDSVESPSVGEIVAIDTPPIKLALFALFAVSALAAGLTVASTAGMFHFEGPGGPEQAVVVATSTPSPTPSPAPTPSPTAPPTPRPATATPTETRYRGTPPAILRTDSPTPSPIQSTSTPSPTPTESPSPTPSPTPTTATPTPTGFVDDGGLFNESSNSSNDSMLFVFPSSLLGLGAATVLSRRR
jgi:hypothetical protein